MKQTFSAVLSIVLLAGLSALISEHDVPLVAGTLLWMAVFAVVFWFLLRPLLFDGHHGWL